MHSDDDFLRQLLADPTDDDARLVYADWLEEHGGPASDAKAEFLRLTVRLASDGLRKKEKKKCRDRLQQLAAGLDTSWLAVVSRLSIENCHGRRRRPRSQRAERVRVRFDFLCDRGWEGLRPTEDRTVRFCDACKQNVHYCDTITEARDHAWAGHCVAVDLGVIRREGDLQRPLFLMGRMSPEAVERERELEEPDAVSAERERRKQKRAGQGG
jgi:uncharacterized protein (TIGR02996 family)